MSNDKFIDELEKPTSKVRRLTQRRIGEYHTCNRCHNPYIVEHKRQVVCSSCVEKHRAAQQKLNAENAKKRVIEEHNKNFWDARKTDDEKITSTLNQNTEGV